MENKRKTVSLVVTKSCNLNCIYCYEANKSGETMPLETAIEIVNRYICSNDASYDECVFEFFGGEPFINFALIQQVCEYTWSRPWEKPYLFFTTTNGNLVHGEIQAWLRKNSKRFYAGLSLDGTPEAHNRNRSYSFSNIDISFFRETWPDQPVKMTISKETLPLLGESVIYLHRLGFKIENNFAFGIDWSDHTVIHTLEGELEKLVNFYLENPQLEPCRLLNMKIEYIGEKAVGKWCGAGTDMTSFDVDGVNYPCHSFLPLSIGREKARLSRDLDFRDSRLLVSAKCQSCILLSICPTCYGSNFNESGDISQRNKDLCKLTKIRALACSYLIGHKIIRGDYSHGSEEMKESAIKAVIAIQNRCTIQL